LPNGGQKRNELLYASSSIESIKDPKKFLFAAFLFQLFCEFFLISKYAFSCPIK
jgi:hypothetical protein